MITNQVSSRVRRMLEPKLSILYYPQYHQWFYNHHPFICEFRGELHAIWSNGERDEDNLGQRVLHCVSKDGVNWGQYHVLFNPPPDRVYLACGLYNNGHELVAYAGRFGYQPENVENGHYKSIDDLHCDTALLARTTTDGENWSEIQDLKLPINPTFPPMSLKSGRLIFPGNVTCPISDEKDGLTGWKMRGLPPCPWPDMMDDATGLRRHAHYRQDGQHLMEATVYQTEDEVLHMLLRSKSRILYESHSTDDGESWSKPLPTEYATCNTKSYAGRLPDGRYFIIGSPDPACNRCPFVISISKDGKVFDREFVIESKFRALRMPGKFKDGIYGYPHATIVGDKMYVICSVNKEDVYVYSFELSQLV